MSQRDAQRLMLKKLMSLVEDETITKPYDMQFIRTCNFRVTNDLQLSYNQDMYLNKLFNEVY